MPPTVFEWTNSSVRAFARDANPIDAISKRATEIVIEAVDSGWSGPPFDPIELASLRGLEVIPRDDVPEARTVPLSDGRLLIEFNPSRPRSRVRYSVAHEIAHTLFADCAQRIRHRGAHRETQGDSWQLELLCNIAAAEFLMPFGTFPEIKDKPPTIEKILEFREKYDVSTEAILIRVAKLAEFPCAVFSASRSAAATESGSRYRLEYVIPSTSWNVHLQRGMLLPDQSVVAQCSAIGFTAKGKERWPPSPIDLRVECVGLPPYPGTAYPRVAGIVRTPQPYSPDPLIVYLYGDAMKPRGGEHKLIAHIVNDKTPNWGGHGFAAAVGRRWPEVQRDFQAWVSRNPAAFKLAHSHLTQVDSTTAVFHMVSQHGYGVSGRPRIRYAALELCLRQLAETATRRNATVHMPRIGTGAAGGSWSVVEDLIRMTLSRAGVRVTVYDLPNKKPRSSGPPSLNFEP